MIVHYCFVRLNDDHATLEGRAAAATALRERLAGLPELIAIAVGTPADESAASWDLSLALSFASLDAAQAARATPAWTDCVDRWLLERAVVVKAWRFAVPG